jgi:hypothetical protein
MGFIDSLKSLISDGKSDNYEKDGYWLYVRCDRCGEVIRTRIDLRRDLNPGDEGGFIVRKTLVGNRTCFERIEATLIFDDQRRVIDHEIDRGELVTAEAYEDSSQSSIGRSQD